MTEHEKFQSEVEANIRAADGDEQLKADSLAWMIKAGGEYKYSYNFSWLGRPIIQYPQDILAMQELVWRIQPDLIIETGIAHGGSLILFASLLELNAACGGPADARVLGIDIDIRPHNREAIEAHPMSRRISMIQGSSIAPEVIAQVKAAAQGRKRVMVSLDSNHTHDHVLAELEAYAPLVSSGSYCVVFDTVIEDTPEAYCGDRPWKPGNSPKTAVHEFLKMHPDFHIDRRMDAKLLISVAPEGYLRRD
ncbi:cephalosporin hydroxylase family protein [Pseudomonas indica]|uniref:cephalosporin hydroxylase family protein n=1 Tax=Pseudomonas indica TaxID=137658 RepID=UPI003FD06172